LVWWASEVVIGDQSTRAGFRLEDCRFLLPARPMRLPSPLLSEDAMSQPAPKKRSRRRKASRSLPPELQHVNLHAAGIDVGAQSHWVAIPRGRDPEGRDVREFGGFTADLYALADWLAQCGIETVAMESTGVYWIPLFEILEERGFQVYLVNPRHLKNVPGRKTDVLDCQWLQQLHTYGLLQGSFRPSDQVCALRAYLRQRAMLVRYAAHHVQHVQKALDQMNVKLHHVVTDITGLTGMRIIRSIVAGERDPAELARLRDPRCKNSQATIAKALEGNWRQEHLFALHQAVSLLDTYQAQIVACDSQIESFLATFEDRTDKPVPPRSKGKSKPKKSKSTPNEPVFDVREHLYRILGVDLTRVDGFDSLSALKLISEIGLDMNRWPTVKHFASWLSLCPNNKISGGKILGSRTNPSANRAAGVFRMAAYGLSNSRCALGAFLRRKRAHLGSTKAITAAGHKLARIVYTMLKHGTEYEGCGQDEYEQRYQERLLKSVVRQARSLGYKLSKIENLQPAPLAA
jgi:transposase